MNKKIFGLMAVLAAVMAMCGCSVNGTPAGMVGKWEVTGGSFYNKNYDSIIEVKSDDTVTLEIIFEGKTVQSGEIFKITKCTCTEFYVNDNNDHPMKYELTCTNMVWKDEDGNTVAEMKKK